METNTLPKFRMKITPKFEIITARSKGEAYAKFAKKRSVAWIPDFVEVQRMKKNECGWCGADLTEFVEMSDQECAKRYGLDYPYFKKKLEEGTSIINKKDLAKMKTDCHNCDMHLAVDNSSLFGSKK